MVSGVPHNKFDIIEAIKLKNGIITRAAKHLNIDFQNIYNWINRDEDVANALKEAREENSRKRQDDKDDLLIELYLAYRDLVRGRDTTAVLFGLKCLDMWKDKGEANLESTTKFETIDYSKAENG